MKLTNEQIKKDMKNFATAIMKCESEEDAKKIDKELDEYFEKYEVPDELNIILNGGYGEALRMML